ncbi:amino acid permease [Aulographum hederae CBS 113979]|uniref:Amino acid permease n=1 Tax=Aulographum hederae CBS 113979 TaxID=1176131 RepID=A0A6G1GWA9_9PEZI|nr:amino acid permease [Aulographum hederae CBS 113979]
MANLDSKEVLQDDVREASDSSLEGGDGNSQDARDMWRMGKTQDLKRVFGLVSMVCFTSMVQATWEVVLIATTQGLVNGGRAGLFWSFVWTFAGFSFVVASLSEMSSMAPTSGGQYHWQVQQFAPASSQKVLSYASGWLSTLSWQAGTASGCYLFSATIMSVVSAYSTSYEPKPWQSTLVTILFAITVTIVNIYGFQKVLPMLNLVVGFVHALGWIPILVILWALAPHCSAHDVFLKFESQGWQPMGLSLMVGQISAVYTLILSDTSAHLSEEITRASNAVPRSMVYSFLLNSFAAFLMLIAYLFAISSLEDTLSNAVGLPFLTVFRAATDRGAIAMTVIILLVISVGTTNNYASTSRQTFAFARDKGLPFSGFLSAVDPKTHVPRNSVLLTCLITILLSLINIGSTVAFNAIISLQLMALMATYTISIGSVLYARTWGTKKLPPARWSLRSFGLPVNAVAFVYCAFILFWTAWPPAADPTAETFNWAIVIFVGVLLVSGVYFAIWGRKVYDGPVALVRDVE